MLKYKEEVLNILKRYQNNRNITFLTANLCGSNSYGYDSWNSDIDVRGIYVEPISNYLRLERSKDCFEDKFSGEVEIDVQFYSLDKALKLISKSNPNILEWLHSEDSYVSFKYQNELRELANEYFSAKRCIYHYIGMAKKDYKKYIDEQTVVSTKKLLNILRCLFYCNSIINDDEFPTPLDIRDNIPAELDTLRLENGVLATQFVYDLLDKKRLNKETTVKVPIYLKVWIVKYLEIYKQYADSLKGKEIEWKKLNDTFIKYVHKFDLQCYFNW